jgi:hypothetical protein
MTGAVQADAIPAGGICSMNTARGAVPGTFALDACVDGSAIWLHNQLSVPVHVGMTGNTSPIAIVSPDQSTAAIVTRVRYPDPSILMPGDLARIPIGSGAASVTVLDANAAGFYAEAVTLSAFLPLGVGIQIYDAIADGIAAIVEANVQYKSCLVGANFIKQEACDIVFKSKVVYQVGKMIVVGLAKGALSIVLNFANWASFTSEQVPSVATIAHSQRTLSQSGKAGALTVPSPAPTPSTPKPSQTGSGGSGNTVVNRTAIVSYDQMRGGAPYWGRSSKGWQGFTAASNTITTVGVTWNDNNYPKGVTLPGITTRISLCTGVGGGADPCVGRFADGNPTVFNTGDTEVDFGDVAVTPGTTYYVFYYQPSTDPGGWDLYWWSCPQCPGTGRQNALYSDQNQIVVRGYNR